MTTKRDHASTDLAVACVVVDQFGERAVPWIQKGIVDGDPAHFRIVHASNTAPSALHHERFADMCFVVGHGCDPKSADTMLKMAATATSQGALTFLVSPPVCSSLWSDMGASGACLIEVDSATQAGFAVLGPTNSLLFHGIVGIDFADFIGMFSGRCRGACTHSSTPVGSGTFRMVRHLLQRVGQKVDLRGPAVRIAYLLTGGTTLTLRDANTVAAAIDTEVHPEADVIWSMAIDDRVDGLGVTMLAATDFVRSTGDGADSPGASARRFPGR